jgi:hypothetical protein
MTVSAVDTGHEGATAVEKLTYAVHRDAYVNLAAARIEALHTSHLTHVRSTLPFIAGEVASDSGG